jgi:hypothetical protein
MMPVESVPCTWPESSSSEYEKGAATPTHRYTAEVIADMCGGNHFMMEAKRAALQSTAIEIRTSTWARLGVRLLVRVGAVAGAGARVGAREYR